MAKIEIINLFFQRPAGSPADVFITIYATIFRKMLRFLIKVFYLYTFIGTGVVQIHIDIFAS